jgi:hypothetical protein
MNNRQLKASKRERRRRRTTQESSRLRMKAGYAAQPSPAALGMDTTHDAAYCITLSSYFHLANRVL